MLKRIDLFSYIVANIIQSDMKLSTFLFCVLLTSCLHSPDEELLILQEIINRDFKDCATQKKLIPLEIRDAKAYGQYLRKANRQIEIPKVPDAPKKEKFNSVVPIGHALFSHLILNSIITEGQFEKLLTVCQTKAGISTEVSAEQTITKSHEQVLHSKSIDQYQAFGYPIISENLLIIYRNHYGGILHADDLGVIGNGTYYIYERKELEWVLLNKVTRWIT